MSTILAIETSCDETAIAVVKNSGKGLEILTNQISSQVKLHAKWGGVVPNLAAREHVKNFPKLLEMALSEAQILPSHIDAIAVTSGPGLIPALMVGVGYAKTLSYLWEKPLLGIHHIEGHIYANFVGENLKSKIPNPKQISNSTNIKFPVLALVVSGGHTELVLMKDHFQYEKIGQTVDDAVGEAFDKVARILGIGYPGGPNVAARAANFQFPISNFQANLNDSISNSKKNADDGLLMTDDKKFNAENNVGYGVKFPRPMLNKQGFNFSFSGLKTAVLYETKKHPELLKDKNYIAEICHEFQQACIDVLIAKTIKAGELHKPKTIMLAGGVSANKELRKQLGEAIEKNLPSTIYNIPTLELTGDNAAMIGVAGALRWEKMNDSQKKKLLSNWNKLQPDAGLKLK